MNCNENVQDPLRPVEDYRNLFEPAGTCSNLFKHGQICSNMFNLLKLVELV